MGCRKSLILLIYVGIARLAQLVEHPLDVGRVRGSNPLSRTLKDSDSFFLRK